MRKDSLRQLYIDELKDLYSAETQLVKALPKMAKASSNAELRQAFEEHFCALGVKFALAVQLHHGFSIHVRRRLEGELQNGLKSLCPAGTAGKCTLRVSGGSRILAGFRLGG